jgi:uncharacterized surface protein with fasciclin (FAS1) repeats
MRTLLVIAVLLTGLSSYSQYYYKDIIGTRQSADLIRSYRTNKVNRVRLISYDGEGVKNDEFLVEQVFAPAANTLRTTTRLGSNESVLTSVCNDKGYVVRTTDSNSVVVTVTDYQYDAAGLLTSLNRYSNDTSGSSGEREQHIWKWENGRPSAMFKIKNGRDTIYVNFKPDEEGNVGEETETVRRVQGQPVFYYYNDRHLLSDIVRYHKVAGRLLPEYMFEYGPAGEVTQMTTVPSNVSSDNKYLIWVYKYNEQGLKVKEAIFTKNKERSGTIEYQYSFGN